MGQFCAIFQLRSGRFWSNANLHICLGIGTNRWGFVGLFFWGEPISAIGEVVGIFFLWWSFTGLGQCDPESLQFPFSGSRVVPHWGFVSFFLHHLWRVRNASYSERLQEAFGIFGTGGDCIQLGNQFHILVILSPAYHVPSMHVFYCVGSNLFWTCALTCFFFQGISSTCALRYRIKCQDLREWQKSRIDKQMLYCTLKTISREMTQEATTLTTTTITTSDTGPNTRGH